MNRRFLALLVGGVLLPTPSWGQGQIPGGTVMGREHGEKLGPPVGVPMSRIGGTATTNVELKAMSGVANGRIKRLGFAKPGDGGAAEYDWAATNCVTADDGAQVQPTGTGCWIADFSGLQPTPMVWGAKGDGVTDDSVAFQAATWARAGNTLWQGPYSYYLGTAAGSIISVLTSTTFQGPTSKTGMVAKSHDASIPYDLYPALRVASGVTINLGPASVIDGVLVYRGGMIFPAIDAGTSFAGTAFRVAGDNVTLRNSLIMGFLQAFTSDGYSRGTISNVAFDNQSNIYINNSSDTWQIDHIHAWPFASDSPTMTELQYQRTGTNFKLSNSNDATMISNYLAFAYKKAFVFSSDGGGSLPTAATCVSCDADTAASLPNQNGFEFTGAGTLSVTLVGPRAYAQNYGIYRNDTGGPDSTVIVTGATITGATTAGIFLDGTTGTTKLYNSDVSFNISGITLNSAASVLDMDGNKITGNGPSNPINAFAPTDNVNIGPTNRFSNGNTASPSAAAYNVVIHQITAAGAVLDLPSIGSFFEVPAGGTISDLTGGWAGREVTLTFEGATTLVNEPVNPPGPSRMRLKGGANFVSAPYTTITLIHPGNTGWVEKSRQ